MVKNKHLSSPIEDVTTEHCPGDPVYSRDCQDVMDTAQWLGRGCDGVTERYVESHKPLRDEEDK